MNKDINIMLQDALDIAESLNIEVGVITGIKWNSRLRTVWGKCFRIHERFTKETMYRIELNPVLNNDKVSWDDAMNTVIHEVLHCHEDRFCHTGEWKRCAELVNREYPFYHIERTTSAEEKGVADIIGKNQRYKYKVYCSKCGYTDKYQREGRIIKALKRNPTSCKCPCGNTQLQLIIL